MSDSVLPGLKCFFLFLPESCILAKICSLFAGWSELAGGDLCFSHADYYALEVVFGFLI